MRRASRGSRAGPPGSFRIIGGQWRSRRLPILAVAGLRPTPDRVRETVFNWLAPRIAGARVLDLFAGSGALGFEALSRGAAAVTLVERDRALAENLRAQAERLGAEGARVVHGDALALLGSRAEPHDIVFLDPPYDAGLLEPALAALAGGWLTADARVYLEHEAAAAPPVLPPCWVPLRSARAGQVAYHLIGPAA